MARATKQLPPPSEFALISLKIEKHEKRGSDEREEAKSMGHAALGWQEHERGHARRWRLAGGR
jgi:hypothetical protein